MCYVKKCSEPHNDRCHSGSKVFFKPKHNKQSASASGFEKMPSFKQKNHSTITISLKNDCYNKTHKNITDFLLNTFNCLITRLWLVQRKYSIYRWQRQVCAHKKHSKNSTWGFTAVSNSSHRIDVTNKIAAQ